LGFVPRFHPQEGKLEVLFAITVLGQQQLARLEVPV